MIANALRYCWCLEQVCSWICFNFNFISWLTVPYWATPTTLSISIAILLLNYPLAFWKVETQPNQELLNVVQCFAMASLFEMFTVKKENYHFFWIESSPIQSNPLIAFESVAVLPPSVMVFSCPEQLNRWTFPLVCLALIIHNSTEWH